MKLRNVIILFSLMAVSIAFSSVTAMASVPGQGVLDRHVIGSVGIETPLGSPDRPQDDTTSLVGDLHLTHLVGPLGVFAAGQLQLHKGFPYDKENKFRVGLEAPLGVSGLTAYTYFERRFDTVDNRFMVGCRWGFNQRY